MKVGIDVRNDICNDQEMTENKENGKGLKVEQKWIKKLEPAYARIKNLEEGVQYCTRILRFLANYMDPELNEARINIGINKFLNGRWILLSIFHM